MKNIIALILFLIVTQVCRAFSAVPIPMPADTNSWALTALAMRANATERRADYFQGKLDTLQHEVDRLETGFLVLVVGVVATLAGICLLTARDKAKALWQPGNHYSPGDKINTPEGPAVIVGTTKGPTDIVGTTDAKK